MRLQKISRFDNSIAGKVRLRLSLICLYVTLPVDHVFFSSGRDRVAD